MRINYKEKNETFTEFEPVLQKVGSTIAMQFWPPDLTNWTSGPASWESC